MSGSKRLVRSRNALLGGVCAGVAGYFNIDPLVVRIIMIVLTFASAGVVLIAYVALWAILPKERPADSPVDVQPEEVHSATFGCVDCDCARGRMGHALGLKQGPSRGSSSYYGTGHVPPKPPACAVQAGVVRPPASADAASMHSGAMPVGSAGTMPPTAVPSSAARSASSSPEAAPVHPRLSRGVVAAITAGCLLLCAGVVYVLNVLVGGVSWWQCWPLVLVALGIVRMVVPGRVGVRMRTFVEGMALFFVGETLLVMSLGIVSWGSLGIMCAALWPVLVVAVVLFAVGVARKSPVLVLAGGLCFALFCVLGLVLFSVPGPVGEMSVTMPYGRQYHVPLHA